MQSSGLCYLHNLKQTVSIKYIYHTYSLNKKDMLYEITLLTSTLPIQVAIMIN